MINSTYLFRFLFFPHTLSLFHILFSQAPFVKPRLPAVVFKTPRVDSLCSKNVILGSDSPTLASHLFEVYWMYCGLFVPHSVVSSIRYQTFRDSFDMMMYNVWKGREVKSFEVHFLKSLFPSMATFVTIIRNLS